MRRKTRKIILKMDNLINRSTLLSISEFGILIRSIEGRAWLLRWSELGAALGGHPGDRAVLHSSPDSGWVAHIGLRSEVFGPGELEERLFGLGECVTFPMDDGTVCKARSYEGDRDLDFIYEASEDAEDGNGLCSIIARRFTRFEDEKKSLIKIIVSRILEWSKYSVKYRSR